MHQRNSWLNANCTDINLFFRVLIKVCWRVYIAHNECNFHRCCELVHLIKKLFAEVPTLTTAISGDCRMCHCPLWNTEFLDCAIVLVPIRKNCGTLLFCWSVCFKPRKSNYFRNMRCSLQFNDHSWASWLLYFLLHFQIVFGLIIYHLEHKYIFDGQFSYILA